MKDISHTIHNALESKIALGIFIGAGILCIAVIIFTAGMAVGMHKAEFGHHWNENYERNFGMIHHGPNDMFNMPLENNFPNAHGASGKIIKVELPTFIVEETDGTEKVVHIDTTTHIHTVTGNADQTAIVDDAGAVVIGEPNTDGQIEAKFIRILPPIPTDMPITPLTK